jgi:hypothetical protein
MVQVFAARVGWLEALALGDDVFTDRFGIPVVPGWVGFPRPSKPPSTRHAANRKTRGERICSSTTTEHSSASAASRVSPATAGSNSATQLRRRAKVGASPPPWSSNWLHALALPA